MSDLLQDKVVTVLGHSVVDEKVVRHKLFV